MTTQWLVTDPSPTITDLSLTYYSKGTEYQMTVDPSSFSYCWKNSLTAGVFSSEILCMFSLIYSIPLQCSTFKIQPLTIPSSLSTSLVNPKNFYLLDTGQLARICSWHAGCEWPTPGSLWIKCYCFIHIYWHVMFSHWHKRKKTNILFSFLGVIGVAI